MRIAAAIFVGMHGAGHVVWFLATWFQGALGTQGREELDAHRPYFAVQPDTLTGKLLGIASLAVLAGFVATGYGIWTETSWWPPLLFGSAGLSMLVILAMWNPIMRISVRALLANIGLVAAAVMPWGDRILGAH